MSNGRRGERLVAVALLGLLLFNYPLISLFSREDRVLGIPELYAYLFFAWTMVIALIALIVRRS